MLVDESGVSIQKKGRNLRKMLKVGSRFKNDKWIKWKKKEQNKTSK